MDGTGLGLKNKSLKKLLIGATSIISIYILSNAC
jgi:hypothetical protein